MKLTICDREREVTQITPSQYMELLHEGVNLLILGKSGRGKSAIIKEYANKVGKKLKIINLASKLPEAIGGIPYATDKGYYKELLSEELLPVLEEDGEDWIIDFEEINQGAVEVLNCLYGICYPMGEDRNWCGHSLSKAQIVANGNLNDGSDGTVYLNDLPTPLLNRFFVYELIDSRKDTLAYLKTKWKNIPQVAKYINVLLDNNIPPRDIEACLDIIAYEKNGLLLQAKIGEALTAKLYDIQKKMKVIDPAEILKNCRKSYEIFKEDGEVTWNGETISTEDDLVEKFKEILSDEEIASIVKGVE